MNQITDTGDGRKVARNDGSNMAATGVGPEIEDICANGMMVTVEMVMFEDDKTKGGIIVPDTVKKAQWSRVLSVGPDVTKGYIWKGETKKIKPGDFLVYHQGVTLNVGKKIIYGTSDINIICVVPAEAWNVPIKSESGEAKPEA